ncbi:Uu.00g119800.m01.CDS01 [Anthostomella pinea]|uniref:Uu.00g119800.m01.CDS01 n=1 Tax=Anthostomella pinea TaxID=933095 RepID=A0AAI8VHD6_9PEZI|nr:Uu.00g119800.m01.CDS01 [Anthostomella pinea]
MSDIKIEEGALGKTDGLFGKSFPYFTTLPFNSAVCESTVVDSFKAIRRKIVDIVDNDLVDIEDIVFLYWDATMERQTFIEYNMMRELCDCRHVDVQLSPSNYANQRKPGERKKAVKALYDWGLTDPLRRNGKTVHLAHN